MTARKANLCPACGTEAGAKNTRVSPDDPLTIRRYRKCARCETKWFSFEHSEEAFHALLARHEARVLRKYGLAHSPPPQRALPAPAFYFNAIDPEEAARQQAEDEAADLDTTFDDFPGYNPER